MGTMCQLLSNISLFIVSYQILTKLLPWIYLNIIGPQFIGPKVNLRSMGKWAVVTGATDGIGKSYAKLLAKNNINIVLISRSASKLENVAKEIRDLARVEVKTIAVDFTNEDIYENLKKELSEYDIGVLVNNVGVSYEHPEFFVNIVQEKPNFVDDLIAANIKSVLNMSSIVLPGMLNKKKGVIINISSTAAVIPNPLLSIYSATKAFVNKFSIDLQTEYRSQGIIVQSIQPGFVATNMTKIRRATLFSPNADTYVESALKTIGYCGHTAGYWPHNLLQTAISLTSHIFCEQFSQMMVFKTLLQMRNKAIKKRAK